MFPISSMALAATRSSGLCTCIFTPAQRGASAKVCPYPSSSPIPLSTSPLHLGNSLQFTTSEPASSHHLCGIIFFPRLRAKRSTILAAVGTDDVVVEPATNVKFPNFLSAPGGSKQLALVGAGFREKTIAFIGVKVYAVGIYIDPEISSSLSAWQGKSGEALSKDTVFLKAVAEAPVEKAIHISLVRDVDGAAFWGALNEALAKRLKAANAGPAGQDALVAFGKVFQSRPLKQGTSIYLTWVQPSKLQVGVSGAGRTNTAEASIESATLASALFDAYLGEDTVSPTAKASVASRLAALI